MTVLVRPEACPVVIAAIWAVPKLPAKAANLGSPQRADLGGRQAPAEAVNAVV